MLDSISKIKKAPSDDSKILLKGPTGSGKSTLLLERYNYLIEEEKVPSEKILILLLNRSQSLEWRTKTLLNLSGNIWRTSFYGFVQGEINLFYPILLKNCKAIKRKNVHPVFLTFELAQFLLSKVIEHKRKADGLFTGVTSYTDRISIVLAANLVKAATSDIPYSEIGERLYNSLEIKDEIKKQAFNEADQIISAYRKKCLELGVFDFGMSVDLYNNYLLKDNHYKEILFSRVQHLIVDNIEECVPVEIDFINLLLPNLKTCMLSYNDEGGYGEMFGSNHQYVKEKIAGKLDTVNLKGSKTCNDYMFEFSDMLFDNIKDGKKLRYKNQVSIERNASFELRSDMLDGVAQRVLDLINEGYKPSDIAIISTNADSVSEFVIARKLEKYGYSIKNISRKNRITDNSFSQALITFAELCHPSYNMLPNRDDIKALVMMILKIDPVRSSILAGQIMDQKPFARFPDVEFPGVVERIGYYNVEKYEYIRNWIEEYKTLNKPMKIDEFFQRVFLEILVSENVSDQDIMKTRNLIDSSRTFVEIISRFRKNANRDFLEMIKGGVKAAESIFELEEKLSGDHVIMTTPVAYLASSLTSKVTILMSLSSRNWTPRNIKELTNVHVLTKTWDKNTVYTEDLEEEKQKNYLAIIIRAILKRCSDRLITFESDLSANGFENDGILSEYFDEILKG